MDTRIALTLAAERRLDETGRRDALLTTPLGAWTQVGDRVALGGAGDEQGDFVVVRRRILPDAGHLELELTLDWPARS